MANRAVAPVTLEVTLAPSDLRHALWVLPHQLRVWGSSVSEIVCTIDIVDGFGRQADQNSATVRALVEFVDDCIRPYSNARRVFVDASDDTVTRIGRAFFGGAKVPPKDFRGLGFLSYFVGLDAAQNDYVLHVDSDMLFGGDSVVWLADAIAALDAREDILQLQPLLAPPTDDGDLRGKRVWRDPLDAVAYRFADFSTRCYFVDKRTLTKRVGPLPLVPWQSARQRVPIAQWLTAMPSWNLSDVRRPLTLRLPPYGFAEWHVTQPMERLGLLRVSMLGSSPGMWMLHPGGVRTERIHDLLPSVVEAVEADRVPEGQLGRWDLEVDAWA